MCHEIMEIVLAVATVALAWFTAMMFLQTRRLAQATFKLASEANDASFREIGVQVWMHMKERFDSTQMEKARSDLANKIRAYNAGTMRHNEISETVFNFFEDLGSLQRHGYIDEKLAASTFSFYLRHWWFAGQKYVDEERKRNADTSLLSDFQKLAEKWRKHDDKITPDDITRFLSDECTVWYGR